MVADIERPPLFQNLWICPCLPLRLQPGWGKYISVKRCKSKLLSLSKVSLNNRLFAVLDTYWESRSFWDRFSLKMSLTFLC